MAYNYDRQASGPTPEVRFKAKTPADIKKRLEAYKLLFEVEPVLRVRGTITDINRDISWLKKYETVKSVGATLVVDLGEEGVSKYALKDISEDATFMISGH